MHNRVRRKLEMLERVREFGKTNAALFSTGTRAKELFSALDETVTTLQQLAGSQSSRASGRNVTTSKSVARSAVLDDLDTISLNARALALHEPGLENKFRFPRTQTDQDLLATARAFTADALPLKDQFIALQMPPTFLEDLQTDIDEFEATLTERRRSRSSQVSATASLETELSRGIDVVQELRAVVHNLLNANADDNSGLMAAWLQASHTVSARRRSVTPPAQSPVSTPTKVTATEEAALPHKE